MSRKRGSQRRNAEQNPGKEEDRAPAKTVAQPTGKRRSNRASPKKHGGHHLGFKCAKPKFFLKIDKRPVDHCGVVSKKQPRCGSARSRKNDEAGNVSFLTHYLHDHPSFTAWAHLSNISL